MESKKINMEKMKFVQNIEDFKNSISRDVRKNVEKFLTMDTKKVESFNSIGNIFEGGQASCKEGFFGCGADKNNNNDTIVGDILDFRNNVNKNSFSDQKIVLEGMGCNKQEKEGMSCCGDKKDVKEGFIMTDEMVTTNEMASHSEKNIRRFEFEFYSYVMLTGLAIGTASFLYK